MSFRCVSSPIYIHPIFSMANSGVSVSKFVRAFKRIETQSDLSLCRKNICVYEWRYFYSVCLHSCGDYNYPKPVFGQILANHPLELLCFDFNKIDPAKNGRENVLVLTDAFTKFSLAVVTTNQKALTVTKVLVVQVVYTCGMRNRIHSDQGISFHNEIIGLLCKLYGVEQTTTCP